MKISIIVPIYNVANYISRCFDSIYKQRVDDSLFEIIAVNDGSSDNSSEIVKEYQLDHNNIKLIEQPNGGVSSARNKGIKFSCGDYLLFVDPDDVLIENSLRSIISYIEAHDNPVIVMRSFMNGTNEVYVWNTLYNSGDNINCIDVINKGFVRGSVCGCAFCRDFIVSNKIIFPEGVRNSEDTIFFFHCMGYCEKIHFANIAFYNIVGRENSASRSFSIDRVISCVHSVKLVDEFIQIEQNKTKLDLYNFLKFVLILNTLTTTLNTTGGSLSLLRENGLSRYKHMKCRMITYKRIQMFLLNFSISISYIILKLRNR